MILKIKLNPQNKGICKKLYIINPKKPNSALRKVAKIFIIKYSKNIISYINGEGYCIKEHNYVLIFKNNKNDLIGVKFQIIRGVLDSSCVKKRKSSRSKYGTKKYIL